MEIRILRGHEIKALLTMEACIDLMHTTMIAVSEGRVGIPPRTVLKVSGDGMLGNMPGYLAEPDCFGVKLLSLFPSNTAAGYSSHLGLVLLFEPVHGLPVAMMDAAEITAIRTAAVSGLATRLLANPDAGDLAILGAGEQAHSHLAAMLAVRPIRRVRVWSRTMRSAKAFASSAGEQHGIDIEPLEAVRETVEGADLICTVTMAKTPILLGDWVEPGAHLNVAGASRPDAVEVDTALVTKSRYFADFRPSVYNEAAEYLNAIKAGAITPEHILAEIGEVANGTKPDTARANIQGLARRTPLWKLDVDVPGTTIYLKLENLQPLGSFKIRAAVNALKTAGPDVAAKGVLSASAGNFGLGLALAAKTLGAPVTIVAPDTAAETKAAALRALGATVIRVPFDEWWGVLTSRRYEGADGVFFHPVAESAVVAGNATIGAEILEDLPEFDTVIVPFGGGGLISGIGSVIRRLKPNVRMIAVEAESGTPMVAALAAGKPTKVVYRPGFVDGIGSTTVLDEMWPLVRETVDAAVCVSFSEIAAAIRLLAARHRVIAEGAGAAALAAAMTGKAGGGAIVCIVSGGNIDGSKLSPILEGKDPA